MKSSNNSNNKTYIDKNGYRRFTSSKKSVQSGEKIIRIRYERLTGRIGRQGIIPRWSITGKRN